MNAPLPSPRLHPWLVRLQKSLCCLALLTTAFADGQLQTGPSIALTVSQRETLVRLVRDDPDAARHFRKLKKLADASLDSPPHAVATIVTAGKLNSDPAKIETRAALEDMKRVEALGYAQVVTPNDAYVAAARRIILAWARTNQPTGMPIDETKLEPLFVAYDLTRPAFSTPERERIESWLRNIARQELAQVRPGSITAINNWNSHRLKIVGLIGYLLGDRDLISHAVEGFKRQVEANLRPDGSSLDFHERDALHYHCYNLEPLLTLALAARRGGVQLYDYQAPNGASLRKSVNFLTPYCDGTATHAEWVNSKVDFDRARAEAGEERFAVGSKFDPRNAVRVLELASVFDEGLKPLLSRLSTAAGKYPSWQSVVNAAGGR